jgi:DNA-binding NtrC family response regulator
LKPKILIVDDDLSLGSSLKLVLSDEYDITCAESAKAGVQALYQTSFDCVLLDMNMPGITGMELLRMIRQRHPELPVIMLTANEDPHSIIETMRAGASDYVIKKSDNLESELRFRLSQVIEKKKLIGAKKKLEAKIAYQAKDYEIVGSSEPTLKLLSQVATLKGKNASVLIHGETGTGKELVARALNRQEKDGSERPFIVVNCGAISENLAESEFFGHERGAFTGAIQRQEGKFVAADGGDIFLDEIGELSLAMQVKLLRVIQERVVTPVGSIKSIPVNVRIIAATHRDLQEEVRRGRFREDLYYRLSVVVLKMPPLRERREDIPLLVEHLLKQLGAPHLRLNREAFEAVMKHSWPGNIRSLRNCLERARLQAPDRTRAYIGKEDLILDDTTQRSFSEARVPLEFINQDASTLNPEHFREFMNWAERTYYQAAYAAVGENKTRLSEKLGQSRDYVHRKLKSLGIGQPELEVMP